MTPRELFATVLRVDALSGVEATENPVQFGAWVLVELQFLKELTSSDSVCFCVGVMNEFLLGILRLGAVDVCPFTQFVTGSRESVRLLLLHKDSVDSASAFSQSFELSSLIFKVVGEPSGTASV